mgnify:CR=1 FL=1
MADEASTQKDIGRLEGMMAAIHSLVSETRGDVKSLRNDFMEMEKGRLSRLEVAFATVQTEVSLKARNTAVWFALVSSIAASVITGTILFLITNFLMK